MIELVNSHANTGSTTYLLKLAMENAVKGHRVLFASPEMTETEMMKRLYVYSEYKDYIQKNITLCRLPFTSEAFNYIIDHIRGLNKYAIIIIDCASMIFNTGKDSVNVLRGIMSRTNRIICGMQLNRISENQFNAKSVVTMPYYLMPWVSNVKCLYKIQERSLDGELFTIMNVFSCENPQRDSHINFLESYSFNAIKHFGVRLVKI